MKIVIDGRMYEESGVGRYIRNLIDQLQKIDKRNKYFILHLKSDYDSLSYFSEGKASSAYHTRNFSKVLANFKWYGLNEQLKLPYLLKQINPDLVHFPHFNVPIFYKGKFVVTIHDLIHQHFQMRRTTTLNPIIYKFKQFGYEQVFKNAINKSSKILAPSNYVKKLLVKEWKVPEDKIRVTYEAVDDKIATAVAKMSINSSKKVLEKFEIKNSYIFYVGNAHPHKNVEGLIRAYLKMPKPFGFTQGRQVRQDNVKLVLSGSDHYFWQRVKKEYQHKDIIYTGFVSDEELVVLYKNAQVFVMPSFEEGFGIPLLEAMACSCPIVSSNGGALKEVAGDAAIYFDPHSMEDMINKISRVLNSEKLKEELIEKGLKRYRQFSWKKLAKQTLEVYKQCV